MENRRKRLKIVHLLIDDTTFPFLQLLKELQVHVLSFLAFEDILQARSSCRTINELIDNHFTRLFVNFTDFPFLTGNQKYERAESVFTSARNLYGVNYSMHLIDEKLIRILPRTLQVLNLSHCALKVSDRYVMDVDKPVSAQTYELMMSHLPPALTDLSLNYTIKSFKHLEDDGYISHSFSTFPRGLTKLELMGCFLNDHSLENFPPKLKHLDFLDCPYYENPQFQHLPTTLTWLRLERCNVQHISHLNQLTELHCQVDKGMKYLTNLAKLQTFSLKETFLKAKYTANLPISLTKLMLRECGTDRGFSLLGIPTKITRVELHLCDEIKVSTLPIQLRSLRIVVPDEFSFDVTSLQKLTNLTSLELIRYQMIVSELQYLPKSLKTCAVEIVPHLELIDITVEDELHHYIPNCKLLEPDYVSVSSDSGSESEQYSDLSDDPLAWSDDSEGEMSDGELFSLAMNLPLPPLIDRINKS